MKKFMNRLCVVSNEDDLPFDPACNYIDWLFGTIMRVPVQHHRTDNLPNPRNSQDEYGFNGIILLPDVDQSSRKDREYLQNWLDDVNQEIPIIGFYGNFKEEILQEVFGVTDARKDREKITKVVLDRNQIADTVGFENAIPDDYDDFIFVEPVHSKTVTLALVRGEPFITRLGINTFIGEKGLVVPREDRYLEFNRPSYYMQVLYRIVQKWPVGLIRARLAFIPIGLRLDDPPGTTVMLRSRIRMMNQKDYRNLWIALKETGLKLTCAVVPAHYDSAKGPVPWKLTEHKEQIAILNILADAKEDGTVEIALHGLTHMGPDVKLSNPLLDVLRLRRNITPVSRELYDQSQLKEIDYDTQYGILKIGKDMLEDEFGTRCTILVPPTHAFDDSTERILSELGMRYLSADMSFQRFDEGASCRKNPSVIGTRSSSYDVTNVSATILGPMGSFNHTIDIFGEIGIPILWTRHIYPGEDMRPEHVRKLASLTRTLGKKRFMFVSEIGILMDRYARTEISASVSASGCAANVKSDVSCDIQLFLNSETHTKSLEPGQHNIEFSSKLAS